MPAALRIPSATYRLQFNRGFRFRDAAEIVGYLARLGVSDLYASPVLKAGTGSTHGYDVTDPTRLNPELGGEADFREMAARLKRAGLGLLLDIVPNHMAASSENPWWRDVGEKGSRSPYDRFFDTDWLDFGVPGVRAAGHRRFFDLGQFVGVRVEDPAVFRETHALIFHLIEVGAVTGLRIDHIDGLYDPLKYLKELQARLGGDFYIVVEKILTGGEALPPGWPVCGTTGYDFSARLNELFVGGRGLEAMTRIYKKATGHSQFRRVVLLKKSQVMCELFPREVNALADYLAHLSGLYGRPLSGAEAGKALVGVTACLTVYRTYVRSGRISRRDRRYLEKALGEAEKRRLAPPPAIDFLRRVLTLDYPAGLDSNGRRAWRLFVMKWQQLTGAVMAKGYEDTALYDYNRLVSLNDVGGDPASNGINVGEFHRWVRQHSQRWPHSLNATSTHDSKRSEDVRARINYLTEVPGEWAAHLERWMALNRPKKILLNGRPVPDANMEWFLYQTMLGAWPLDEGEIPGFVERLKAYMIKAAREAKSATSWIKINTGYEDALCRFTGAVLVDGAFLKSFQPFQHRVAFFGALNSLAQLLLKATLPGVPDIYQGSELWDFSLVDPDNRRPVDFGGRAAMLNGLRREEVVDRYRLWQGLKEGWRDGRIKMYVTCRLLNARRENHELFLEGDYRPLYAGGFNRGRVVAFVRRHNDSYALALAPRFFTGMSAVGEWPVGEVWGNTRIVLPSDAPSQWTNVLTGETVESHHKRLYLRELLRTLPVALLLYEDT